MILPAVVALVAANVPAEGRPRAFGLVMAAGGIAVAVGPLIGGVATTYFSWRWVFVGEVVIVVLILFLARRMEEPARPDRVPLDVIGATLLAIGLGLAVYGVLRSSEWGWVIPRPGGPLRRLTHNLAHCPGWTDRVGLLRMGGASDRAGT